MWWMAFPTLDLYRNKSLHCSDLWGRMELIELNPDYCFEGRNDQSTFSFYGNCLHLIFQKSKLSSIFVSHLQWTKKQCIMTLKFQFLLLETPHIFELGSMFLVRFHSSNFCHPRYQNLQSLALLFLKFNFEEISSKFWN